MPDLGTDYLGFQLPNPLVASSSPLAERVDELRRLEEAGIAAVVLHSLFEEQIHLESHDLDNYLSHGSESYQEARSYFPELSAAMGPTQYLEHVARVKRALRIPVIASLNGASRGGWTRYARRMEDAGADALELNVYYVPTDPGMTGPDVEAMYLDLVRDVTGSVRIPVAVKLTPFFSAPVHMAGQMVAAGAAGLVLFNRFYQPDLDLENLEVVPTLALSSPWTLRMRLRWAAIMYGHVAADLAITGGVHQGEDVIKAMMVGAKVAMTTSALLRHGPGHVTAVLDEMRRWMEAHEYDSVRQMRGSMSHRAVAEPAAFERANYMKVLRSWSRRGERAPYLPS